MTAQSLFEKYGSLNAHYAGERPLLGSDVKCVQCDGCDRVITFAVFHSEYDGGVDVCNMCRVAAQQSKNNSVVCLDGRRRLRFAEYPLCFVGPAPLPDRYVIDTDEIEVEHRPELLKQRFAKSVDVVARRKKPRETPRKRNGSAVQPKTSTSERLRRLSTDDNSSHKAQTRSGSQTSVVVGEEDEEEEGGEEEEEEEGGVREAASPPPLPPPPPPPPLSREVLAPAVFAPVAHSEGDWSNGSNLQQGGRSSEVDCADRVRLERIANGQVARFFLHIHPGTRVTADRPVSLPPKHLVVVDRDKAKEFVVAPNTSRKTSRGFVGLASCGNTLCVRIVPTMPEAGLWFSMLCEEECSSRLDLWHFPVDAGAASSPQFAFADGALPTRKYSVEVGRQVAVSMDWLPVPLHRRDNNALGFCTFIRGQYLLSTLLPRDVAAEPAATGGCVSVSTEVCSATLIDRSLELVDIRWGTNGISVSETFLFVIGRCTSVMVLRPSGDTRSGMLTLQLVHYIRVKGVAPYPPFVSSPPVAIGSMRGNHLTLMVSHGASVACYRAPEFSTRLFVALDDVVCSMQLHERRLIAGLANGVVADVGSGEAITVLQSPPLLINCLASAGTEGDVLFVADASGECMQTRKRDGAMLQEECIFSICRVQHGREPRLALSMGGTNGNMSSCSPSDPPTVHFVQHPLRHLTGGCTPLLAFYPDGVWLLAP